MIVSMPIATDGRIVRLISTLDLVSGSVRRGGVAEIVSGIKSGDSTVVEKALAVAIAMKFREVQGYLPPILKDDRYSLNARLRAAVLLALLGDQRGAELVSKTALKALTVKVPDPEFKEWQAIEYSIERLPVVLGEKSLPLLKEIDERFHSQGPFSSAINSAYRRVVDDFVGLLDGKNRSRRIYAGDHLGELGPHAGAAVPALTAALADEMQRARDASTTETIICLVKCLGHVGPDAKEAKDMLMKLKSHDNRRIRDSAEQALKNILLQ